MRFKVVCSDIDGTLLNAARQLSPRTIEVFRRLTRDTVVVLASSRMPAAMRHLQDELGIATHPMICYNGAFVINPKADGAIEVVHNEEIPLSVVQEIIELSEPTVHVSLYYRDEWYAPGRDYWADREATITKVEPVIASAEDVLRLWETRKNGAHKVMCMGPEEVIAKLESVLNERLGQAIHVYRSRPTYLELAPIAISKGSALRKLIVRHGAAMEEVISFGDNYNDIDMLNLSGWGVAVMNAIAEVKAVANEVAGDSRSDGVAIALEKHMFST